MMTRLIQPMSWLPVHSATARLDDCGMLLIGDGAAMDYHLLRWTDPRANGVLVKLTIVAKPTEGCTTNIYVHHWGERDICSIASDGTVVLREGAEELLVEHGDDGFLKVSVTFQNNHDTLSLGMGKPGGVFQGTGTDQYVIKSIEAELSPLSPIRQMLVERIWRGSDPLRGFSGNLFEDDIQGWGSRHHYLADAVAELRPSVIVDVGVWKGGSTIFMAEAAKALALDAVVIAVDTWLGSSEHWLSDWFFREMSFLNGYPALYHKFLSNVVRAGVSDCVLPIPLASIGAAEVLKALNVRAGIIHIDAAHDYDSVTADLRAWWPVLEPGGVLIGDDYFTEGGWWASVRQAFDDFFGALGLPIESDDGKCRVQMPR